MAYRYNIYDNIHWFDTTAQLASDSSICTEFITAKAAALDAPSVVYISNGTAWIKISDGSTLAYYTISITLGANTTVTIVDAAANVYTNGMRVQSGATLTITAAADTDYTLSTYTVNTVDKTGDNPTTHVVSANVVIVTAATAV
jgi:hypothetical protein